MRDLEQRITEWRTLMRSYVGTDSLNELEEHLRESITRFVNAGHGEEIAFQMATKQFGPPQQITAEFDKVHRETWWALKAAWILAGVGTVALFVLFLAIGVKTENLSWLLASHVFAVTGGYLGTFMVGALGICFVFERCFHDFSPGRQEYLARAMVAFAAIATAATAIAIGLGMIWAKISWGRYWGWDYVEVGALGILVWQLLYIAAGSVRTVPARALMLMAIAGNIVVTFGWFGANAARHNNYGTLGYTVIVITAIAHLIFIAVGLGPASWMRLKKEA